MTITANKTKLYKLVAERENLPPMKETTFMKLFRRRSYWLWWRNEDARDMEAYFSAGGGRPILIVSRRWPGPHGDEAMNHRLTVEDLRARGMIEELPTAR